MILAYQVTYNTFDVGIYAGTKNIAIKTLDKREASAQCIVATDQLLNAAQLTLKDITYLVVNRGPAPFTSLRVAISTVNGLAAATGIPIIGVNGLHAYVHEWQPTPGCATIIMLNAFNNDVYYAMAIQEQPVQFGCMASALFAAQLPQLLGNQRAQCIGNGIELVKAHAPALFATEQLTIVSPLAAASLTSVVALAQDAIMRGAGEKEVMPLYLKEIAYQTR
ncbi:MAG: tRNA (adenosine(37)-N6)-threonylcarbamoyltransferase complex dimerization subunit type 1 TsaB [Candidatus Babeliales bacterium]